MIDDLVHVGVVAHDVLGQHQKTDSGQLGGDHVAPPEREPHLPKVKGPPSGAQVRPYLSRRSHQGVQEAGPAAEGDPARVVVRPQDGRDDDPVGDHGPHDADGHNAEAEGPVSPPQHPEPERDD